MSTIDESGSDAEDNLFDSGITDVLSELKSAVQALLPAYLSSFFKTVDETLFDRADEAKNLQEQRVFFDAMRMLRNCNDSLQAKIANRYFQAFESLLTNDLSLMLNAEEPRETSLSLLDNHILEEMIALDSIVSSIVIASGEDLTYLTKRLEYVFGQQIRDEENPFVPELLVEITVQELTPLQFDLDAKLLILNLFEKHFVGKWPVLVKQCNQRLKERGVRTDLETQKREVVKEATQDAPETAQTDQDNEDQATELLPDQELGVSQVIEDLYRLLGNALPRDTSSGRENQQALTVPQVLHVLATAFDQTPKAQVALEIKQQGLESALSSLLAAQNTSIDHLQARQRAAIKVLERSFKTLDQQSLSPRDLPDLVTNMAFPVAAMALRDPQFLDKQNHPGRRLVNEIFNACSTFLDGEDSETDPLRKEVDGLVDKLTKLDLSPKDLTRMLSEFIDFIEKDKKKMSVREKRLLEEEEAMAKVSVAHSFVYDQLVPVLLGKRVPRFLLNFCEDAWSKVIFLAVLREGKDSGGCQERLRELVRLRDFILEENPEFEELKTLMALVGAQLDVISLDPAAHKRWLHLFHEFWKQQQPDHTLSRSSVFDLVEVTELILRLPGVMLVEDENDEEIDLRALESVDSLRHGIWVEFRATETSDAVRCKLAGIVQPTSNFVFTNRKGVKVAEESRRRLAAKLKRGNVVVLENRKIFDHAFDKALKDLKKVSSSNKSGSIGSPAHDD